MIGETVELIIPGVPQPKGRPRFTRTGRAFTDAKTLAAEQSVLAVWLTTVGQRPPHEGPVAIQAEFHYVPPASWPKWRRAMALEGLWPHTGRPDLDNLVKILDGLNGVAWHDDSQIHHFAARKAYAAEAHTRLVMAFQPPVNRPEH